MYVCMYVWLSGRLVGWLVGGLDVMRSRLVRMDNENGCGTGDLLHRAPRKGFDCVAGGDCNDGS